MDYTISTITYIKSTAKLQALIGFIHNNIPKMCVGIIPLANLATSDITQVEADPAFIAMCNATIDKSLAPPPPLPTAPPKNF